MVDSAGDERGAEEVKYNSVHRSIQQDWDLRLFRFICMILPLTHAIS